MQLACVWKFLKIYREREGLSCNDCAEVDIAFERYDPGGKGEMSTVDVGKALRWFGYQPTLMEQQQITQEVDVDRSGHLNKTELRKFIRVYWERELRKMQSAFSKTKTERLSVDEVDRLFRRIHFVDKSGQTPDVPEKLKKSGVERADFMSLGIKFKQRQRQQFRRNAGYTHEEVVRLRHLFQKYDADRSGSIATNELGALIKTIFPVMNKSIRSQLDMLMKEIDADGLGTGRLGFEDFLRTMRQFHDIQNQERLEKMEKLVTETGFNHDEVKRFHELFVMCDWDRDGEMSEVEVRKMMEKVCPLGDKNLAELHKIFVSVREHVAADQALGQKLEGRTDAVDFPEFLLLMRKLLDNNFANIQGRLAVTPALPASTPSPDVTVTVTPPH
jgi:Ca2+-binding EF-hand superfamily protein